MFLILKTGQGHLNINLAVKWRWLDTDFY